MRINIVKATLLAFLTFIGVSTAKAQSSDMYVVGDDTMAAEAKKGDWYLVTETGEKNLPDFGREFASHRNLTAEIRHRHHPNRSLSSRVSSNAVQIALSRAERRRLMGPIMDHYQERLRKEGKEIQLTTGGMLSATPVRMFVPGGYVDGIVDAKDPFVYFEEPVRTEVYLQVYPDGSTSRWMRQYFILATLYECNNDTVGLPHRNIYLPLEKPLPSKKGLPAPTAIAQYPSLAQPAPQIVSQPTYVGGMGYIPMMPTFQVSGPGQIQVVSAGGISFVRRQSMGPQVINNNVVSANASPRVNVSPRFNTSANANSMAGAFAASLSSAAATNPQGSVTVCPPGTIPTLPPPSTPTPGTGAGTPTNPPSDYPTAGAIPLPPVVLPGPLPNANGS
jgi:hypothetical protein